MSVVVVIAWVVTSFSNSAPAMDASSLCGPVSVYVGLTASGVSVDFQKVLDQCHWDPNSGVELRSIVEVLRSYDEVKTQLLNVTFPQLRELIRDGDVAIVPLHMSSDAMAGADHVICFVDASTSLTAVEYPDGRTTWNKDELSKYWSGDVILIRPRYGAIWPYWRPLAFVVPIVTITFAAMICCRLLRAREFK